MNEEEQQQLFKFANELGPKKRKALGLNLTHLNSERLRSTVIEHFRTVYSEFNQSENR